MKKIFLFTSALLVSATMMAQLVGWSAVELSNETAAGTSTVNRLYTNGQGDVFFLGNSASNGEKPTISFDGITLDAAPYRVVMSRTNTNIVFGKLSGKDASTQWFGASDRGAFTSYVATPTADGKFVMAVTANHTDSNYLADDQVMGFNMQMTGGATASGSLEAEYAPIVSGKSTKLVQFGSIVEVSDKGFAFVQDFDQMTGQNAGFTFADIVTDGTNFYVLTILKPGIVVGEKDTIKANVATGSAAILKFNDKWQLVGSIVSAGIADNSTMQVLKYTDGKLYYACTLKGTADKQFVLGDKSVTTTANSGLAVATLSTDLQCESLAWTAETSAVAGLKTGNISVYDGYFQGTDAYLTGSFMGGILVGENDTLTAAKSTAFVTKVDLTTGKSVKTVALSEGSTQGRSFIAHNDSLYVYAYDYTVSDGRIALYGFDNQLNMGDTIRLVNAQAQETAWSAVLTNKGKLAYATRTRESISFSVAPEEKYTAQDHAFRGVLAVQQLFENPEQAIDNTFAPAQKAEKFIRNGQLYIRRGEHIFNALGQQL